MLSLVNFCIFTSQNLEQMISNTIATRRAVFPVQYNSDSIAKEELEHILEAANWAPTHRRTEPWRFKVFYSESSRKELSQFLGKIYQEITENPSETKHKKIMEKPLQSACVLAICMQRDAKGSVPEWEEVAATAMAVQNLWLTAHEMNIGGYWSSPSIKDHLHRHVELASGESCLGFFYLGKYDSEVLEGTRKTSIEEKTVWF